MIQPSLRHTQLFPVFLPAGTLPGTPFSFSSFCESYLAQARHFSFYAAPFWPIKLLFLLTTLSIKTFQLQCIHFCVIFYTFFTENSFSSISINILTVVTLHSFIFICFHSISHNTEHMRGNSQ